MVGVRVTVAMGTVVVVWGEVRVAWSVGGVWGGGVIVRMLGRGKLVTVEREEGGSGGGGREVGMKRGAVGGGEKESVGDMLIRC